MNYKRLLPFDDYLLHTSLSQPEVRNKVASVIEPNRKIALFSLTNNNTKPYKGKLTNHGFEISRFIDYRNSFLPQIKGTIVSSPVQTIVHITMRPHLFTLIFMSAWLSIVGMACISILFSLIIELNRVTKESFSPGTLIPFGMFAVGYGMLIIAYRIESRKSKVFLAELFSGK